MTEEFAWAPGHEGSYMIGSRRDALGQFPVYSVPRTIIRSNGSPMRVRGRILRQVRNRAGVWTVLLCREGKYQSICPHKLARELFNDEEQAA